MKTTEFFRLRSLQFALAVVTLFMLTVLPRAFAASTLTAAFVGVGSDQVSEFNLSRDGRADFHIVVGGLRSAPSGITITSDTGGIWNTPSNGTNWIVGLANLNGTTADIYFSQFSSNRFHVRVSYSDGSSDETDATNQSPVPSTLSANFIGIGSDAVSQISYSPDGQADFQIHLGGLRAAATQISVTSDTGGIWNTPFDGQHWVVGQSALNGSNTGHLSCAISKQQIPCSGGIRGWNV